MNHAKLKDTVCELVYISGGSTDWFGPLAMEAWVSTYDAVSTAEDVIFVDSLLCLHNKKNVLDIGCGHGRHIELLSKQFELDIVGIDSSSALVQMAKVNSISSHDRVNIFTVPLENIVNCCPKIQSAYSLGTSFGYGEDFTLLDWMKSLANIIMTGGLVLLETVLVKDWYVQQDVISTHRNMYGHVLVVRTQKYEESQSRLVTKYLYEKNGIHETSERVFKLYSLGEFRDAFFESGFSLVAIYNRERKKIEFDDISSRYSFLIQRGI